jgi:hypothetical protein
MKIAKVQKIAGVELTESRTKSGGIACNIFDQDRNESIELDIQEIRIDKLNDLGIN